MMSLATLLENHESNLEKLSVGDISTNDEALVETTKALAKN